MSNISVDSGNQEEASPWGLSEVYERMSLQHDSNSLLSSNTLNFLKCQMRLIEALDSIREDYLEVSGQKDNSYLYHWERILQASQLSDLNPYVIILYPCLSHGLSTPQTSSREDRRLLVHKLERCIKPAELSSIHSKSTHPSEGSGNHRSSGRSSAASTRVEQPLWTRKKGDITTDTESSDEESASQNPVPLGRLANTFLPTLADFLSSQSSIGSGSFPAKPDESFSCNFRKHKALKRWWRKQSNDTKSTASFLLSIKNVFGGKGDSAVSYDDSLESLIYGGDEHSVVLPLDTHTSNNSSSDEEESQTRTLDACKVGAGGNARKRLLTDVTPVPTSSKSKRRFLLSHSSIANTGEHETLGGIPNESANIPNNWARSGYLQEGSCDINGAAPDSSLKKNRPYNTRTIRRPTSKAREATALQTSQGLTRQPSDLATGLLRASVEDKDDES
eukprot:GHVQ01000469.1.p1 GENE.GHVQ01000469.1~~GHVQ01000469.1.p1  ORF type:complete len:448 (+),score=50.65 GHVQ01000469.1:663-2006(+)